MTNAVGTYQTTTEAIYKAFDKLPKPIRERLAEANGNWVPQPILTQFRRYQERMWTGEAIDRVLAMLDRWNEQDKAEHFYRMDRMHRTGVDYNVPIRMNRKGKN